MSQWKANKIYFWFSDKYDTGMEDCLPYNPEKLTIVKEGNNEEITTIGAGAVTLIKDPKLETIELESFFAHPDTPRYYRSPFSKWTPRMWESFFEEAMNKKKVIELTIEGLDLVLDVTVESFQKEKRAGREKDTYFTLRIKKHKWIKIKEQEINIVNYMPPTNTGTVKEVEAKDSIGNTGWLLKNAWKYFTRTEGLVSIYESPYKNDGSPAIFNWLPVTLEEKLNIPVTKINLTNAGMLKLSHMVPAASGYSLSTSLYSITYIAELFFDKKQNVLNLINWLSTDGVIQIIKTQTNTSGIFQAIKREDLYSVLKCILDDESYNNIKKTEIPYGSSTANKDWKLMKFIQKHYDRLIPHNLFGYICAEAVGGTCYKVKTSIDVTYNKTTVYYSAKTSETETKTLISKNSIIYGTTYMSKNPENKPFTLE